MDLLIILLLFAVSALGGAINSVAGGGTFLTFPVLIFAGQTPLQANITSTMAMWPGGMASAYAYKREWLQQKEILPGLMLVSLIGSIIGTAALLLLPEQVFTALVPWLLLSATLIFTFGRRVIRHLTWFHNATAARALQFIIAIYGGYFGAGMGILMLAMLQMLGFSNIHRMNALKTVLGATINAVAVMLFVISGKVVWDAAIIMIIGGILGGYAGAAVAQRFPPEPVRWLVSAIGVLMTGYFFLK